MADRSELRDRVVQDNPVPDHAVYYFAYGSNMEFATLSRRIRTNPVFLGIGYLQNFRYFINMAGYGSVREDLGSKVYGVAFSIPEHRLKVLDHAEAVEHGLYVRKPLRITMVEGPMQGLYAQTYIDPEKHLPLPGYQKAVIDVAKDFEFPPDYIKHLQSLVK